MYKLFTQFFSIDAELAANNYSNPETGVPYTMEEMNQFFVEPVSKMFVIFPNLVETMQNSFFCSIFALIMPFKMLLFTVHNYLTKRDYTYQIDDLADLAIATCVVVWIVTFYQWNNKPVDDGFGFANTLFENYTFNVIGKFL